MRTEIDPRPDPPPSLSLLAEYVPGRGRDRRESARCQNFLYGSTPRVYGNERDGSIS